MINSILIKNFQSHTDSTLNFSPGINVIVGASDSGKTAVIRAFDWIRRNRPLGDSFIHHGSNLSEVRIDKVHRNKQALITRIKGKNRNEYIVESGENKLSFTAFGEAPPNEILFNLNLQDINVQRQFEPFFLVFDPPGKVAEYIRGVTKLDEIDKVKDLIDSKFRKTQLEVQSRKTQLSSVDLQLVEINKIDLDLMESLIKLAKVLIISIADKESRTKGLLSLTDQIRGIESKSINLPDDIESRLSSANEDCKKLSGLTSKYKRLKGIIEELRTIKDIKLDIGYINGLTQQKEEKERKYNKLKDDLNKLLQLVERIGNADEYLCDTECEINEKESSKQQLMEQMTNCPYCGSELNEESKKALLVNQ